MRERQTKLDFAKDVLRLELVHGGGLINVAELEENWCVRADISARTFRDAKRRCGLVSLRRDGQWWWATPERRAELCPPSPEPAPHLDKRQPKLARLCTCGGAVVADEDGDPVCLACGKQKVHRLSVNGYEDIQSVARMSPPIRTGGPR